MKNRYFITGGAGFIGSHVCENIFFKDKESYLVILDKLTYAGNKLFLKKIINSKRVKFIKGDISNSHLYSRYLDGCDIVINIAAESHVDNSFSTPVLFTKNNILGSHIFLDQCIKKKIPKILHISSDEVYGDKVMGNSKEEDSLNPTNPYSASKAGMDLIINSYNFSMKNKIKIIRANNVYGIRQYPEKLIPKSILKLLMRKKIQIHGDGRNQRHYVSVYDFAEAVFLIIKKGEDIIYNIGSDESFMNIDVVKKICAFMKKKFSENVIFIKDRPYNDKRYAINYSKLKNLGWRQQYELFSCMPKIIEWYSKNYKIYL